MRKDLAILPVPIAKRARAQKGGVLVEFAFILPLFLVLLFGMITFSTALYNKTVLTMATREGARAGAIYDPDGTNTSIARAQAAALQVCQNNLISFGPDMTANVTANVTPTSSGDILTVTASGNYSGIFLFSGFVLSAQTSMRLE